MERRLISWTERELEFLELNYKTMTRKAIAEHLGTKTAGAVRNKVSEMGWGSPDRVAAVQDLGDGNVGDRYEKLEIIAPKERVEKAGKVYYQARCRCDCGDERDYLLTSLRQGRSRSCGCRHGKPRPKVGDTVGRLTIDEIYVAKKGKQNASYAKVTCSCGKKKDKVLLTAIHQGTTVSCGCWKAEKASERITEKNSTHDMSHTRLYREWAAMKTRATNANLPNAKDYVGRGIGVCQEWLAFEPFRDWALANGYSNELTLDRRKNDEGYSPDNCRWVDLITQQNNRRSNRLLTVFGETKTVAEWSRDQRCVVSYQALYDRIHVLGWSEDLAITTPIGPNGPKHSMD